MALIEFSPGTLIKSSEVNANFDLTLRSAGLAWINMCKDRALTLPADGGIFVEAYTSAGGRQSSVNTLETANTFSTNKYIISTRPSLPESDPYILINADSVGTLSVWSVNDCVMQQYRVKWYLLTCTSGTYEVKRAKLVNTLRAHMTSGNLTNVQGVYTEVSKDVGKRMFTFTAFTASSGWPVNNNTLTFSSTIGNEGVTAWGSVGISRAGGNPGGTINMPTGELYYSNFHSSAAIGPGLNTDASSFELDNPGGATLTIDKGGFQSNQVTITFLVLSNVDISATYTKTDHFNNIGLTSFGDASTVDPQDENVIVHNIPAGTFPSDMSSSFLTFDPADFEEGASVDYKLQGDFNPDVYVIIEASGLVASAFQINNCAVKQVQLGKWVVYCNSGSNEVRRSQIYKTLYYGTNGTNPALNSVTSPTAIRTSVARDVGKNMYFASMSFFNASSLDGSKHINYTGTFSDTSTNSDISVWSRLEKLTSETKVSLRVQLPSGTDIQTRTSDSSGVTDYIGTDRESDEKDNQATIRLRFQDHTVGSGNSTSNSHKIETLVLTSGNISWALTGNTSGYSSFQNSFVKFSTPSLSAAVEDISSNEDTGWLIPNKTEPFTPLTAEPDELIVRLTPKSVSPTAGVPSVRGICLQAGRAIE